MPTKTTKTAAKSGAKKPEGISRIALAENAIKHIQALATERSKNDRKRIESTVDRMVELHNEQLTEITKLSNRLTALEQAAKPTDPPPAEVENVDRGERPYNVVRIGDQGIGGTPLGTIGKVLTESDDCFYVEWATGITRDTTKSLTRPATSEEIAEHKRKEEESKVTELQEGDGCECSREESDELVALTKDAGLPSFVSKGHPIPLWWQGQLNSTTKGHFTIKQLLPFAEFKRRLLGTIARLKSEAEAKEMAMPLDFGTRVEFDDGREMRVACPWPSKLTGKYSLVDKDGDGNPRFYTVERHRFTVIP